MWRPSSCPSHQVGERESMIGSWAMKLRGWAASLGPEIRDLLRGGRRADEHAVAAGLVGRLDHQLPDIFRG
jgi:hypothetical protein